MPRPARASRCGGGPPGLASARRPATPRRQCPSRARTRRRRRTRSTIVRPGPPTRGAASRRAPGRRAARASRWRRDAARRRSPGPRAASERSRTGRPHRCRRARSAAPRRGRPGRRSRPRSAATRRRRRGSARSRDRSPAMRRRRAPHQETDRRLLAPIEGRRLRGQRTALHAAVEQPAAADDQYAIGGDREERPARRRDGRVRRPERLGQRIPDPAPPFQALQPVVDEAADTAAAASPRAGHRRLHAPSGTDRATAGARSDSRRRRRSLRPRRG